MKTGPRYELDLIIRESPFLLSTRVRTRQAQTRNHCMTLLLPGYGKSMKASRNSLRLKLAMLKYFGRATLLGLLQPLS